MRVVAAGKGHLPILKWARDTESNGIRCLICKLVQKQQGRLSALKSILQSATTRGAIDVVEYAIHFVNREIHVCEYL